MGQQADEVDWIRMMLRVARAIGLHADADRLEAQGASVSDIEEVLRPHEATYSAPEFTVSLVDNGRVRITAFTYVSHEAPPLD